ncbi:UNVERIFIED_CONTAM: hypothetical protein K2H54_032833 [Gekko kuhli]
MPQTLSICSASGHLRPRMGLPQGENAHTHKRTWHELLMCSVSEDADNLGPCRKQVAGHTVLRRRSFPVLPQQSNFHLYWGLGEGGILLPVQPLSSTSNPQSFWYPWWRPVPQFCCCIFLGQHIYAYDDGATMTGTLAPINSGPLESPEQGKERAALAIRAGPHFPPGRSDFLLPWHAAPMCSPPEMPHHIPPQHNHIFPSPAAIFRLLLQTAHLISQHLGFSVTCNLPFRHFPKKVGHETHIAKQAVSFN